MVEARIGIITLRHQNIKNQSKTNQKPVFLAMKSTLNINFDPAMMTMVAASLNSSELGRLFRAITACMAGEDAGEHLSNSALKLAYALLRPSIDESLQRLAVNRANGAKGGRPRKHPAPVEAQKAAQSCEPSGSPDKSQEKPSKKSKKEENSPTPPKEEKNKKNSLFSPARETGVALPCTVTAGESLQQLQQQMLHEQPWLDELCMSRHISAEDMTAYLNDFVHYLRERDMHESLPQAKVHFVNQLPYIIKKHQTSQNHENNQEFIADPVARRKHERESRRQEVCRLITELAAGSQQPAVVPF